MNTAAIQITPEEDALEALRLARAHSERLIVERMDLELRARIAANDLSEQVAANRDLRESQRILLNRVAELEAQANSAGDYVERLHIERDGMREQIATMKAERPVLRALPDADCLGRVFVARSNARYEHGVRNDEYVVSSVKPIRNVATNGTVFFGDGFDVEADAFHKLFGYYMEPGTGPVEALIEMQVLGGVDNAAVLHKVTV